MTVSEEVMDIYLPVNTSSTAFELAFYLTRIQLPSFPRILPIVSRTASDFPQTIAAPFAVVGVPETFAKPVTIPAHFAEAPAVLGIAKTFVETSGKTSSASGALSTENSSNLRVPPLLAFPISTNQSSVNIPVSIRPSDRLSCSNIRGFKRFWSPLASFILWLAFL